VAAVVSRSQVGHHRPHIVPMRPRIRFPRRPHFLQHAVLIHRPAPRPATPPACRSAAARTPPRGTPPLERAPPGPPLPGDLLVRGTDEVPARPSRQVTRNL